LGEVVLAIDHEKKYYGENTKRMQHLILLKEVQEKVFNMALARDVEKSNRDIEKSNRPKKPHLKIVK
jgi:hypothetical protein